jgi:transposase
MYSCLIFTFIVQSSQKRFTSIINDIQNKSHPRGDVHPLLKYSYRYGVTKASKYYRVSRNAIYEWRSKYDGKSWKSLVDRSHRPHHHPSEHTPEEKEMILRRYPRYKDDMMLLWDSLRKSGYKRRYTSLIRVVRKWVKPEVQNRTKNKSKPYTRAEYPGQKMQLDVKYVPSYCVANGQK